MRSSLFVRAQEDEAEGEETDDGAVEDEDGGSEVENEEAVADEEETNKNVHKSLNFRCGTFLPIWGTGAPNSILNIKTSTKITWGMVTYHMNSEILDPRL